MAVSKYALEKNLRKCKPLIFECVVLLDNYNFIIKWIVIRGDY